MYQCNIKTIDIQSSSHKKTSPTGVVGEVDGVECIIIYSDFEQITFVGCECIFSRS